MADYKGIKGFTIQNLSADPPAPKAGQVWYNSTSNVLKGYASVTGAWASGGNRNERVRGAPGAGSQTAAITAGGSSYLPGVLSLNTETYDGTSWTEVNNLPTAVFTNSMAGNTTAALMWGGDTTPAVQISKTTSWDGTSWTEVSDLLVGNINMAECIGTQTAALSVCGGNPTTIAETVLYNGTSWADLNDVNTGRSTLSGSGISTAGIIFGGSSNPPLQDFTETFNGTVWTEVGDLINAREAAGSAMQGTTSSTLVFAGNSPAFPSSITNKTEEWNRTSWTEFGTLATARAQCGGSGTASAALCFGGIVSGPPTIMNTTEAWNSGLSVVTFTSS